MNLEGLTLRLLTARLQQELLGGKIYKITMPSSQALLLFIRREHSATALLADLSGGSHALYIPDKLPENPETPPAFCMLLRKHLEEGRITKISQSGLDRVITLEIDLLGAASKLVTKKLVFELAGKNSNIILTKDEMILDCLRHVSAAQSSYRQLQPARPYLPPPPQTGLDILSAAPEEIAKAAGRLPAANIAKALVAVTTGIGKMTATELLLAADILPQQVGLDPAEEKKLAAAIAGLQERLRRPAADAEQKENMDGAPVYAVISRTNQVKTILVLPPQNLGEGLQSRKFADINSAVNFAAELTPIRLPRQEELQKLVASESAKTQKKLAALQQDLTQAADAEQQRVLADTLMANLYQLRRGQSQAELASIYDGQPLSISLSPRLSPTENAQAYYKRYNKYKRAQAELAAQLEQAAAQLQYLDSLSASLLTAGGKNEIEEIRREMQEAGLLREPRKKQAALPKSQPLHIRLPSGSDIYIGKNNRQNDYVTFTLGGPRDLWLHTKDIPGSHVLLKSALPEAPAADIQSAVELAAYFSKARGSSSVPVDCVQRRYVKKPAGSRPGFVIFTNQTTFYTTPDEKALKEKYRLD